MTRRKRRLEEARAAALELGVQWARTRDPAPKDSLSLALLAAMTRYDWLLTKPDSEPPPPDPPSSPTTFSELEAPTRPRGKVRP